MDKVSVMMGNADKAALHVGFAPMNRTFIKVGCSFYRLSDIVTTQRGNPRTSYLESDLLNSLSDVSEDFFKIYVETGRSLYDISNRKSRDGGIIRKPTGSNLELQRRYEREVRGFVKELIGSDAVKNIDIKTFVTCGSAFLGRIYYPGEDFFGERLGKSSFSILVNYSLYNDHDEIRLVAAHEARHLFQFHSGILSYPHLRDEQNTEDERQEDGTFVWDGKQYQNVPYSQRPHEIDAKIWSEERVCRKRRKLMVDVS